ncbi:MAG TPA: TlpA family protein disulfide reductase [Chromatiales bacterium]|nr:TlpA family protein disulfide reductase [Chromatiales bacterium]
MKASIKIPFSFLLLAGALMLPQLTAAGEISGPAPDFTLKSRGGENLKLSEFRGEVVMINFWASWCAPCRQEMPLLDQLYNRYSPMGFTILGINVEEDSAQAEKLLKEIPVSFPILYDTGNTVTELYKVMAMPSTVMVDRDGNMRYLHLGYLPGYEVEYEAQIRELIKE